MKRRDFLQKTGAAATGIYFLGCGMGAMAQSSSRRETVIKGRRMLTVDIHAHSYVHDVWDLIKDREEAVPFSNFVNAPIRSKLDMVDVATRISKMDEQGIDIQAVSLHVGQYHRWAERDLAAELVRIQNEKIAELCSAHPDRFVGLGAVALQHPDLAVEQMEYAVKQLDMRGFMITGSVNDEELSSERFHPFWARAEDLGTVIFIHPDGFTVGNQRFKGNGRLDNVIGNPLETTVALSHLIFEGTLDKFPGLKICAAHGGGYLPSYIGRSDHCVTDDPRRCNPVEKLPSEYLKNLYFDSLVYTTEQLQHIINVVGASRIVIGTDYPFEMGQYNSIDHVLSVPGLSDADREAILGGTAARLLNIRGPR